LNKINAERIYENYSIDIGGVNLKKMFIIILITICLFFVYFFFQIKSKPDKIAITYEGIQFYLDGRLYSLKDKENRVLEPFSYKDTVYLPVEEVSAITVNKASISNKNILSIEYRETSEKSDIEKVKEEEKGRIVKPQRITKTVRVEWVKGKIQKNDRDIVPESIENEKIEFLIIEGKYYLPFDIMAEAIEKEGVFSDDTKSVYFQDIEIIEDSILNADENIFSLERIDDISKKWLDSYEFLDLRFIGESFEGRSIKSIVVDYEKDNFPEKEKILLISGIHAREDYSIMLNAQMLDRMLFHLTHSGYWGEFDLKDLFSKIELHVILTANPDGLNIVNNGISSSGNYNDLKKIPDMAGDHRWWKANARGVDLNRNFPDSSWDIRSSEGPASEGYKGEYAGSEPETKAIVDYCEENNFILSVSYHTSGNKIFWADIGTHDIFNGIDSEIADKFADLTGYEKLGISQDPKTYGSGFENWFRENYQRPSFCVELSPYPGIEYVQHPNACFDSLVWKDAKYTGLSFMAEALKLRTQMYDVYEKNHFKKTFYSKEEAIQYAQKSSLREIRYRDQAVWER